MTFWFRELMGWLLVILGLGCFALCFAMLSSQQFVETIPVTLIGIFVFRGGLHLLKVAVAARLCLHAEKAVKDRLTKTGPVPPRQPTSKRP